MHTNVCIQQDGHCTYYVTLGRVRVTFVAVGREYHILSVCSLRNPAYKEHAPYYMAVCGISDCTEFPRHLMNGTIFGGGGDIMDIKCVF